MGPEFSPGKASHAEKIRKKIANKTSANSKESKLYTGEDDFQAKVDNYEEVSDKGYPASGKKGKKGQRQAERKTRAQGEDPYLPGSQNQPESEFTKNTAEHEPDAPEKAPYEPISAERLAADYADLRTYLDNQHQRTAEVMSGATHAQVNREYQRMRPELIKTFVFKNYSGEGEDPYELLKRYEKEGIEEFAQSQPQLAEALAVFTSSYTFEKFSNYINNNYPPAEAEAAQKTFIKKSRLNAEQAAKTASDTKETDKKPKEAKKPASADDLAKGPDRSAPSPADEQKTDALPRPSSPEADKAKPDSPEESSANETGEGVKLNPLESPMESRQIEEIRHRLQTEVLGVAAAEKLAIEHKTTLEDAYEMLHNGEEGRKLVDAFLTELFSPGAGANEIYSPEELRDITTETAKVREFIEPIVTADEATYQEMLGRIREDEAIDAQAAADEAEENRRPTWLERAILRRKKNKEDENDSEDDSDSPRRRFWRKKSAEDADETGDNENHDETSSEASDNSNDQTQPMETVEADDEEKKSRISTAVDRIKDLWEKASDKSRLLVGYAAAGLLTPGERKSMLLTPEEKEAKGRFRAKVLGITAVAALGVRAYFAYKGMDTPTASGSAPTNNETVVDATTLGGQEDIANGGQPPIFEAGMPASSGAESFETTGAHEATPEYSAEAFTVAEGEGFYQTFKDLGIPKEDWPNLLDKVGPQLADMEYSDGTAVAYFDETAGEWRLNMSPDQDGKMPRSVLDAITEAHEQLDTGAGEVVAEAKEAVEKPETPENVETFEQSDRIEGVEVDQSTQLDKLNNIPEGMGGREYVKEVLGMDPNTWDAVQHDLNASGGGADHWFYDMPGSDDIGLREGKMPDEMAARMFNALTEAQLGNSVEVRNPASIPTEIINSSRLNTISDIPVGTNIEDFMKKQGLGHVWLEINKPEVAQQLVNTAKDSFSFTGGELHTNGNVKVPTEAWKVIVSHMNEIEKAKFGVNLPKVG